VLNGLQMNTLVNERSKGRRLPWKSTLAVIGCALIVWLVHPPVLSWLLRLALDRAAFEAGLQVEIGEIHADLARPIVFEGLRVRSKNVEESQTAADATRVEIALESPWRAFIGPGRWVRSLIIEDVRGVLDLRQVARWQGKPHPRIFEAGQRAPAPHLLRWLPEEVAIRRANLEFLALAQSYYFEGISAEFSEERVGEFRATGAELRAGSLNQSLGSLTGVTAWKSGTVYLAGVDLWEGVKLDSFEAQLVRPGGVALGIQAALFGGSLRFDVSFDSSGEMVAVDSALWGSNLEVAPLAALCGFYGNAEGVIRDARFTFRGIPERALDGQASLRLAADGFRWNKRGWESLELGARMIHRRLAVNDFVLKQKENALRGGGEFSLDQGWVGMATAPFLLNLNASINDLGALAGLFGPPFDDMTGRMSLAGSINGQAGKLGGFLSLEGSDMGFRKHPIESGQVEVTFANAEAQVTRCEFWSGEDFLRAKGSVEISAPHTYSGEIQARTRDIAGYRSFFRGMNIPELRAGAIQIRWQGDGTASAHSGAFNVSLEGLVSEMTPGGVTGRFGGTYSPQNIYFGGFELDHGSLRFSTRATLARSGIRLDDVLLRAGGRDLVEAEIYLPVDPFELAAGRSLKNALHLDEKLYAEIVSKGPVSIRELFRLTGNDRDIEGTLRLGLTAEGSPSDLKLDGTLEAKGLSRRLGKGTSPPSHLRATLQAAAGAATLTGELTSPGVSPITFKAESAFGIAKMPAGTRHWINPEGRLSANLEIPEVNLAVLTPLFTSVQRVGGLFSGSLAVAGTVGRPLFDGRFAVNDGQLEISPNVPMIGKLNGSVVIASGQADIEQLTGELGEGFFAIYGGISFKDLSNPHYDLYFTGNQIDLVRLPWLQLRANASVHGSGDNSDGLVKGDVRLADGRLSRKLEVTPLLAASMAEDDAFAAPRFDGLIPAPFARWKLDVAVTNDSPILFSGSGASGEIIPDLRLTGSLGTPIPVGQITLKDARAFLPFTTITIPDGHLEFKEQNPWMPQLNIHGTARALDYEVQVYAFGTLDERRLILRSDPPLPQESLIQLLTTGMTPGVYAQSAFGAFQAPESLTTGPLGKKFSLRGNERGSALPFNGPAAGYPPGRTTLHGRFELWRGLSLIDESDDLALPNDRVTFRLRLR
jgi:TamB, inner membrane protein subunit of TAM complex